jgi:UDP-N-acetylglucosamine--N-acetylmuramyl-(pentapeptide) pyrophosphoryl-undecaprenol N-acetylglucosamine transferase
MPTPTPRKIIITGGGTGGHVFPALAIAEELRARGYQILYVGTERGMEAKLVPAKGFAFLTVRTGSVKNQSALRILKTLGQLVGAIVWGIRLLRRERPLAVVGVGGYVSVPVCVAAFLCRVPMFLQEQNTSVGIANRFLGRLSRRVFLGFDQAREFFPSGRTVFTGNPIRREFYAPDLPAYDPTARCLVVLGGSQGAQAINQAIVDLLPDLPADVSIVHQTGQKDLEATEKAYRARCRGKYEVSAFISDMPATYARASLVISRSGALTVSELIQVGRPAILVPYPRKGQNDQTTNAYWLEKCRVAKVVEQGPDFPARLATAFREAFEPERLRHMAENFSQLRTSGALVSIADQIEGELTRSAQR